MEHKCKVCVKNYSSYQSLWIHTKKFHKTPSLDSHSNVIIGNRNVIENKTEMFDVLSCKFCKRKFKARQNRWSHEKICKIKNTAIIKQETKETKEPIGSNITNNINNQLINIIIDKTKIIEKLKKTSKPLEIIKENRIEGKLILNDVIILSRVEDNYINATQLCKAGNKKFNDWVRLNSFGELINELECDTGIPASQLIDVKKR
jgi:uncharacterized CHY-type Zn-finger protein